MSINKEAMSANNGATTCFHSGWKHNKDALPDNIGSLLMIGEPFAAAGERMCPLCGA
jgi:hypothetical protein